ncbi:MAG TPA: cytochrome c biogenesis protein CcsA [Actinomycetota bacterium]|jgi:heme exporter protein C|nr:cytochrome c biogenesis protein CcsA [Actinomycetota bacterium]
MKKDPLALGVIFVAAALSAGLFAIFFWVPTEEFQGVVQRIFYVHAPSAWVAYLAFAVVLVGSLAYLRTSDKRWDLVAHASAEVGVMFTGLALVTGMLWGRPIWGAFWVWDPRLTLTLVLFVIYVGYLAFRSTATDPDRGARVAAVIGITGFAAVPLIHFSVDWWRGQHPGRTVFRPEDGPALPEQMLITVAVMALAFTALYAMLLVMRVRLLRLEDDVDRLEAALTPDVA